MNHSGAQEGAQLSFDFDNAKSELGNLEYKANSGRMLINRRVVVVQAQLVKLYLEVEQMVTE